MFLGPTFHPTRGDVFDILAENYKRPEFADERAPSRYGPEEQRAEEVVRGTSREEQESTDEKCFQTFRVCKRVYSA